MKKILLFNPPLYFSEGVPYSLDVSVPPLGLLYLASYLNNYYPQFRSEVIDITAEKHSLSNISRLIRDKKPFVIGITSMTPQLQGAVELAKFLKKQFGKKIIIFLGGPHISADPDFINRFNQYFDYGITGEAEKTFAESVLALSKNKRIPKVQCGEIINDLDIISFPDKKLIDRKKYNQNESMMFSRGCPYHCYYCSRPSISRITRYRSADNLIKEIKTVYKYCNGKIDFQDDTFTLDRKKVEEFCEKVIKKELKLNWRCNSRIDLVDEELLKLMSKSGCSLIHFGIESGNEKVRKEIVNKGIFSNKQIRQTVKWCHKYGIKFAGYFMIGHPQEDKGNLEDTKKMILEYGIDLMGLSIPTPFPGSKLYEIAKREGIINEKIIDKFANKELGNGYVGNYPVYISEKVPRDYVYDLMKEINRKFYVNLKMFWRKLREDITSPVRLRQNFLDLVSLVMKGMSSRKPYTHSVNNGKI